MGDGTDHCVVSPCQHDSQQGPRCCAERTKLSQQASGPGPMCHTSMPCTPSVPGRASTHLSPIAGAGVNGPDHGLAAGALGGRQADGGGARKGLLQAPDAPHKLRPDGVRHLDHALHPPHAQASVGCGSLLGCRMAALGSEAETLTASTATLVAVIVAVSGAGGGPCCTCPASGGGLTLQVASTGRR